MLRVVVLGAAAGGGVPQWNCGCPVCRKARSEHPELRSTQASIAVSADGLHWFLINASPDLRQQLIVTPQLHPEAGKLRHSPIAGVILTNGEVDAVAGLLSMREGSPFTLYGHQRVLAILKSNSIFNVLNVENVQRRPIEIDKAFEPTLPDGSPSGIEVLAFAVPGKGAWYLEGKAHPAGGDGTGDTLLLNNPQNWWPIEQDYYVDGYAFTTGDDIPERLYLKEGKFAKGLPAYTTIKGFSNRAIDGGAATVLDMYLDKNKTLKSLSVHAVANDVVIGLMAATLVR